MNKRIKKQLIKQSKRYASLVKRLDKSITGGNVHQLRITLRRILAIVWIIENGCKKSVLSTQVKKHMRNFNRLLGGYRQLDVCIKLLNHEGGLRSPLSQALHDKLKTETITILKFLKKSRTRSMHKSIANLSTLPDKYFNYKEDRILKYLNNKIHYWIGHDPQSKKELHQFRIDVKKIRYRLESLGLEPAGLKELQTNLGDIHDLEVIHELKTLTNIKKIKNNYLKQVKHEASIFKKNITGR